MNVIKRDGTQVQFDRNKIINAIVKAGMETVGVERSALTDQVVNTIVNTVHSVCVDTDRSVSVEQIQDLVETGLMSHGFYDVAKRYIRYRYEHEIRRKQNTTDSFILSLVEYNNEQVKQENSNKNPQIIPTQRDYIAGQISKDLTKRYLLPQNIVKAHEEGIIHFHDADYFIQHSYNCCLVNLKDMLENGTVISGTLIERPHSFSTACNIATQVVAQVASSQYGGQTISLSHLAPFVNESRRRIREQLIEQRCSTNIDAIVEKRVRKEIERGVQTIQYQVVTLMTTNGQTPFVTVYMDINEVEDEQTQNDLALIIEQFLNQRIKGVKNQAGVWITPAFPKLIYCLDENNVYPGTKYYYLTQLAAKCTAKRMVPDYISAKKMRQYKIDKNGNGNVYPCMGKRKLQLM